MRPICHLNLAPGFRGGERQTELLVRELARRGRSQRLVVRTGSSLTDRCAGVAGLEIREVPANPLMAGLAVRGSAIAHSHEGRTPYSCLFASYAFGVPYVITRRVVAPQKQSFVRSLAYRRAGCVAAVSQAAATELKKRTPDLEPVIVPDATAGFEVDTAAVERIRSQHPGKTLIGHVGALEHSHKGQSTIIEAARLAAATQPSWHFLLCGEGRDEARFRAEIGDLQNVELVGWVDNVGDYIASFDLFLYPSLHEALGSSILDAMQLGLPVVASNTGGIPDIVEDGVNGCLITPGDPNSLLDGITRMLAKGSEHDAIGRRNAEKASQFDVTHMADAYEAVYEELATSH
ncbi:MAG: glycosyltransferase family 4 protein [Pseudomonadota bacterium]